MRAFVRVLQRMAEQRATYSADEWLTYTPGPGSFTAAQEEMFISILHSVLESGQAASGLCDTMEAIGKDEDDAAAAEGRSPPGRKRASVFSTAASARASGAVDRAPQPQVQVPPRTRVVDVHIGVAAARWVAREERADKGTVVVRLTVQPTQLIGTVVNPKPPVQEPDHGGHPQPQPQPHPQPHPRPHAGRRLSSAGGEGEAFQLEQWWHEVCRCVDACFASSDGVTTRGEKHGA